MNDWYRRLFPFCVKMESIKKAQQGIHTHIRDTIYVYCLYLFVCTVIFSPIHIVCLDGAHIFLSNTIV